jgi:hypothetical protein
MPIHKVVHSDTSYNSETSLKKIAVYKHSSLLFQCVSVEEKKFLKHLTTGANFIKTFFFFTDDIER